LCRRHIDRDNDLAMAKGSRDDHKTVCRNRKAHHEYEIDATIEAGIVLRGGEVKALREGKGNLVDAYARIHQGRVSIVDFEISVYSNDQTGTETPRRSRPLLLHAAEIKRLLSRLREPGATLIPLSVYFKGPWAKVELGLAKGRRKHDKRQALRQREAQREMDRQRRRR
jgi:SsrA-binding protein